jgi:O-antigen ligase
MKLYTYQTKLSSKKRDEKKKRFLHIILHIILFLILFSNSVLRNQEHLKLYIGVALIIGIYAFFRGLLKPSRISKTVVSSFAVWLLVLFFMYFFYGVVLTKYNHFDADYFFFMFVVTLVTRLLFIDIHYKTMMEIFIKVCAFASVAVSVYILVNEWSLIISGGTRIGESGSGNVNTVAVYLGIMSIPIIYKVVFERKYNYLIPYSLSIVLMLLTGSKKALLFVVLGPVILLILKNRLRLHKYILPTLTIIVLVFFMFNNEYLYNIIGFRVIDFLGTLGFNIEGAEYSNSTALRLMMYKLGYEAFKSKPIFGGGWFYFSSYSGLGTYSHSNYMELLVTYGIIGFLIYYSMFLTVLVRLKRIIRLNDYAKLLFSMLLLIFINDFAAVSFSFNILNYQVLALGYLFIEGIQKEKIMQNQRKDDVYEKTINSYRL